MESVTFSIEREEGGLRHYALQTTQAQREDTPRSRKVDEQPDLPRVRSGDLAFDALFALALEDMRLNSVSEIRDEAYCGDEGIRRDVFRTGEKWPYVWTRDVAYAVDLGLVALDPRRSANTILFKISAFRSGLTPPPTIPEGSLQIVQDTGSGGSWPVSTDRVSWAFAAEALLDQLIGRDREAFADLACRALCGTIAADRAAAFDPRSGLYGGEQSFLDWRTQTYAPWVTDNLAWMSKSSALSTNACHHRALIVASRLSSERGDALEAERYGLMAGALAQAINQHFWIPAAGLYASLTTPGHEPRSEARFDLLGNALVILGGIAPPDRARSVLSRYPHGPAGAPVYFPQQPNIAVYHNRAIWPFVTAYGLAAAHRVRHVAAADAAVETLMRGAALNLSNMENLEWLTGRPEFDDGPVINSRRQLWSVAGYLGMVVRSFFGYAASPEGLVFEPFLTSAMRSRLGDQPSATLEGMSYQGASLDVVLNLPPVLDTPGYHPLERVMLNGERVEGAIPRNQLRDLERNTVVLFFGPLQASGEKITKLPEIDPLSRVAPEAFAPECPQVSVVEEGGQAFLEVFDPVNDPANTCYEVFRDNASMGWMEKPGRWAEALARRECGYHYAAVAEFRSSGHRSHSSRPLRVDGDGFRFFPASENGTPLENWGAPEDLLAFAPIGITKPGTYAFCLRYHNTSKKIGSGVTCGVKTVRLVFLRGGDAGAGVVQMPSVDDRGGGRRWVESTAVVLDLAPGDYRLEVADFFNMSYLTANETYLHKGGREGPYNRVNIAGLCVITLANSDEAIAAKG